MRIGVIMLRATSWFESFKDVKAFEMGRFEKKEMKVFCFAIFECIDI